MPAAVSSSVPPAYAQLATLTQSDPIELSQVAGLLEALTKIEDAVLAVAACAVLTGPARWSP